MILMRASFARLHHGVVEGPVLVEIELIDLWRVVRFAQLLQPNRAERRHAKHRSEFCCSACDGSFALVME
jgi:hypothetical protein